MNNKINLTKADGNTIQVDVICVMDNTESGKRYLYYTLNEMVGEGANSTVKIYTSKIKQDNPSLDEPITAMEWEMLKNNMGDALRGNTSPTVKYIPLNEINNPASVSEMAIAMPVNYEYISKHRGIYAQAVATLEPVMETVVNDVIPEPITELEQNVATEEPAPTPIIQEEVVEQITSVEPAPVQEEIQPVQEEVVLKSNPINIEEIELKYEQMIESINRLKEQEIEACKRYNATLELNSMHNEQHANYVATEQEKEVVPIQEQSIPKMENVVEPAPITPIIPEPEIQTAPTDLETNWFDMPAA